MRFRLLAVSAAAIIAMACPAGASELLVAAAASLTDALSEVGREFERRSSHRVTFSFGASSSLARQIAEGAPVDLFFSADVEKVEWLERRGLIEEGSRRELLSNQLVVIVPRDSRLAVRSAQDLLAKRIRRIALAEPSSVPAGIYARRYLEAEGLWLEIKTRVIPVLDVRAALAAVASGNVDAGIVYRTDAVISGRVTVAYAVPIDRGPKILYPVAVIKRSSNKAGARSFSGFAGSDAAGRIFSKHGFIALP